MWQVFVLALLAEALANCTSDLGCQLNGRCQPDGTCKCSSAWTAADCSVLNLTPAKHQNGYGSPTSHRLSSGNHSSWGGNAVWDPATQKWAMVVDEFDNHCGLMTWKTNSQCILAESDAPDGPFVKTKVLVPANCVGSGPARDPVSGAWLLSHFGNGNNSYCSECVPGGITPTDPPQGGCQAGSVAGPHPLTSSVSSRGPWVPAPGVFNVASGANCEPSFLKSGAVLVVCQGGVPSNFACGPEWRSSSAFVQIQRAETLAQGLAGQWTQVNITVEDAASRETNLCLNWEDPTLWVDRGGPCKNRP